MNKEYYCKLEKLNLITVKRRDILNDNIFNYSGKKVLIKTKKMANFWGVDAYRIEGEVKFVKYDEQRQKFQLGIRDIKLNRTKLIHSVYESDIESIKIIE